MGQRLWCSTVVFSHYFRKGDGGNYTVHGQGQVVGPAFSESGLAPPGQGPPLIRLAR